MTSRYGSAVKLSSGTNVTNALGPMYGIINQYSATYNFGRDGKAIPFGNGVVKSFGTQEYEFFAQDTFKWKRNLTLTYGLRYSLDQVPYERNGVQVIPVTSLSQFFADRVGGQAAGVPASLCPPRPSPTSRRPRERRQGLVPARQQQLWPAPLGRVVARGGQTSSLRCSAKAASSAAGGAWSISLRQRHGTNFANTGSPGLASQVSNCSIRISPPVPLRRRRAARASGGAHRRVPFTPPLVVGGFTSFSGVSDNLKAPYEYLLTSAMRVRWSRR